MLKAFFKDKLESQSGISELAEGFICQFLNVANSPGRYKLKSYVKGLIDTGKWDENSPELRKLILFLQSFIIFLTFRSNGSPKKVIEIFERYIVDSEYVKKLTSNNGATVFKSIAESVKKGNLYLRFSFIDQYEIGATSNLYRPYVIINSRHLKLIEDKILYSTAFIIDHILKFHNHAFSWSNLELIPDIILANKDPNLRDYLKEIMSYFLLSNIRKTTNAIFNYKFFDQTANEIKYLSKVSALSSAAFNFTLDESSHLKSHYLQKLYLKHSEQGQVSFAAVSPQFIYSISYLNDILGDLHFYDGQYDDAITRYTDSVQTLRSKLLDPGQVSSHQSVLYVRTMLKIGLSLEKKHSFDLAYSIYRSLILQVEKLVENRSENKSIPSDQMFEREWERPYRRMQMFLRPHISLLDVIEKQRVDGITFGNLKRNIGDYIRFLGLADASRFPACAYERADYNNLLASNNESDSKRIQTLIYDYYINVGSLLFYKNKNFIRLHELAFKSLLVGEIEIKPMEQVQEEETEKASTYEISNLFDFIKAQCGRNEQEIPSKLINDYTPSLSAYFYYRISLKEFILPYLENFAKAQLLQNSSGKSNDFTETLNFLEFECQVILNATQYYILGNTLSKLGDSCLAIISRYSMGTLNSEVLSTLKDINNPDEVRKSLRKYFQQKVPAKEEGIPSLDSYFNIEFPIRLYLLSMLFYDKAGRAYSASFQVKKILYVIRDYLTIIKKVKKSSLDIEGVSEGMVKELSIYILKNLSTTSGASNRAEVLKYVNVLGSQDKTLENIDVFYKNTSSSPEIKETLLLFDNINLKLKLLGHEELKNYRPIIRLTSNDVISNIFIRLLELRYQAELHHSDLCNIIYGVKDFTIGKGELYPSRSGLG